MGYMKDELSGFVPTETAQDIVKKTVRGSSILRLSKVEPMTTEKKKIPVFAQGAGAYWVGEGERIQTSKAEWIFPELIAKKLAIIIPVTKEKLDDATLDVFEELKDTIAEAFATTIDKAALFGSGSPFATNLLKAIKDHNMIVVESEDIDLTISDAMAMVEEAGYDVDGFAAKIGVKNSLRRLRDANGAPKFVESQDGRKFYEQPIEFVRNGGWEQDKAKMIAGEESAAISSIRSCRKPPSKASPIQTVSRSLSRSRIWWQSKPPCGWAIWSSNRTPLRRSCPAPPSPPPSRPA